MLSSANSVVRLLLLVFNMAPGMLLTNSLASRYIVCLLCTKQPVMMGVCTWNDGI